ncbi:MAG: hypothetical protein ACOCX4_09940 [Planctomycetota bacterium]
MRDLLLEIDEVDRMSRKVHLRLLAIQAEARLSLKRAERDDAGETLARLGGPAVRSVVASASTYRLSRRERVLVRVLAVLALVAGAASLFVFAGGMLVEPDPQGWFVLAFGEPPARLWPLLREGLTGGVLVLASLALWRKTGAAKESVDGAGRSGAGAPERDAA